MRVYGLAIAVAIASAQTAVADDVDDIGDVADPTALQVHGFVSQGFLVTTDNNYLARTERGSLEYFEGGINFSKQLTERLRVGMQLFSRDLGPIGDYGIKLDWAYLDYRFHQRFGVRAGRIKLPFNLYNDSSDIDAAHPMAILPQSIYSLTRRDFLLAQTGVELYGRYDTGDAGAIDYQLAAGTIFLDYEAVTPTGYVLELNIPYVVAARVLWETPLEGLRVGLSGIALNLDTTVLFAGATMPTTAEATAVLGGISLEYVVDNLMFALEYNAIHTDQTSSDPRFAIERVSEGGYLMASYRVRPWLQGYGYYSMYYPNVDDTDGRDARQHDAALGARFDFNPYWIVKLEGHDLRGTAALSPALNDNVTGDQLVNRWWMLVAKTTAYF